MDALANGQSVSVDKKQASIALQHDEGKCVANGKNVSIRQHVTCQSV
jgi:hypothetical protein